MAEKKYSTLALLEILITYSDENHILTSSEILKYLNDIYGLTLERRTLYSNLAILEQVGYVISKYEDNGRGYFLEEKQFDKGEVLLLCNAIHASHFISEKQSNALIKKLLKTLSKYEANEFKGRVYLPNKQKTKNIELMYTISLISEAIKENKQIQFTYNRYDVNKKLVPRRQEAYIVEPRYIVYEDSRPYLVATNKKYFNFIHFRIDRISKASLLMEKSKKLGKDVDAYEYAKNKLFMYSGEILKVTFLCKNSFMDHMVDLFGSDVVFYSRDEKTFVFKAALSIKGAKFLAQQYMGLVEIIEPQSLRDDFKKDLEEVLKKYGN